VIRKIANAIPPNPDLTPDFLAGKAPPSVPPQMRKGTAFGEGGSQSRKCYATLP
jgi:hypothetical protein